MDEKVIEAIKTMTLRQLARNIVNDEMEDADTGFNWDLTIEQYLKNLYDL